MARPGLDALARALDGNTAAMAGAKLNFKRRNTSTAIPVYSTPEKTVSLGTQLTADAGGKFPQFWFDEADSYDVTLTDSTGAGAVTFAAVNNNEPGLVQEFNFIATASQTAFTLPAVRLDDAIQALVWVFGIRLKSDQYTLAPSGADTLMTLDVGANAGDRVDVVIMGEIGVSDVGVSAAMTPVVQGVTTQKGYSELKKTAGIDYVGAVDSAAALQARLVTARDDSAFRHVRLEGNVKLSSRVVIYGGTVLDYSGALVKPGGNNGLFRVHGNGALIGRGTIDVRDVGAWSERAVLCDGASETGGDPDDIFRLYQRTRIEGHFLGFDTGTGHGRAVSTEALDDTVNNSWVMGLDIDITGKGFDDALYINKGGADLVRTFNNANRARVQWGAPLRLLNMVAGAAYGTDFWLVQAQGQARAQSEQTECPILIAGQHNDIEVTMIDWLGGVPGTVKHITVATGCRDVRVYTVGDPALTQNNSTERDAVDIKNGWPSQSGRSFHEVRSPAPDGVFRVAASHLRLDNNKAIKAQNAAANAEYDIAKLDASDHLNITGPTAAGKNIILNAANATGGIYLRINGSDAAYIDSNKHLQLPGNSGNAVGLRNFATAARSQDFTDADGVLGLKVSVPATLTSVGVVGSWAADADWHYVCYATNTWTRTPAKNWRVFDKTAVASAVTGTTSETTLYSITIPGGALGPNGVMRVESLWKVTNNANNKTCQVKFGGTAFAAPVLTTSNAFRGVVTIMNRNAQNSQVAAPNTYAADGAMGTEGTNPLTAAIDTSTDKTLALTGTLGNSADNITLEYVIVEISYGA